MLAALARAPREAPTRRRDADPRASRRARALDVAPRSVAAARRIDDAQ